MNQEQKYKRYHEKVYLENGYVSEIHKTIIKIREIKPTKHYLNRRDVYGFTPLPTRNDLMQGRIFEYYRNERGLIERFCVRCSHMSPNNDYIYIVSWNGNIVTAWRNSKHDEHKTLNYSLYERREA